MASRLRRGLAISLLGSVIALPALAGNTATSETERLIGLSLEELLDVQVTTLSRKPKSLSSSPAAVFVLTQSDISRSGARTLPDILRMVPGIQVAQVDASTWAVTARGSNGVFANKLLVLQDGRSLYGPMYSGVRWDAQDTDLVSIERIEVIRGPGAVMWGSNAVNGVINIITKNSADTHGFRADVAAGNYANVETTIRWGSEAGDDLDYRIYGKYFDRDGYSAENYDAWDFGRIGARLDWRATDRDWVRLTGEINTGSVGENYTFNSLSPPYSEVRNVHAAVSGGFVTAHWRRDLTDTSDLSIQVYHNRTERTRIAPEERRDTSGFDFQHHFRLGGRHDFVWGFELRVSEDSTTGSETISLYPQDRSQRLYSGFLQDEIRLYRDELFLTVGTKLEHNNFSASRYEWSPNVRLSWLASETTTWWGSVAKAVRTPNRIEQDVRILGGVMPPFSPPNVDPVPFAVTVYGNPAFDSEKVVAYELGFRTQPISDLTVDVALFHNDYSGLRWGEYLGVTCQPAGLPVSDPLCFAGDFDYAELGVTFVNRGHQDNSGLEVAVSYAPTEWWRLHAAYTYLKMDSDGLNSLPLSFGEDAPQHQFSLRSNIGFASTADLDLWLRYVDDLPIQRVPSYVTVDARLAWQVSDALRIALIGRNLFDSSHVEFHEEFGANTTVKVQREALAELAWQF